MSQGSQRAFDLGFIGLGSGLGLGLGLGSGLGRGVLSNDDGRAASADASPPSVRPATPHSWAQPRALAWGKALRAEAPTFVALDFETANRRRDSACAVGAVRVERGVVVERYQSLIRPPTRHFEFTWLHGISWRDVANAPGFRAVWYELRALCEGVDFLAAHNASFDAGVLDACCDQHGLPRFDHRYECTVALARRVWNIHPTKLDCVAGALGIPLRHHEAMSDAQACADIVLRAWAA
jgi:DNA polymerase-3 subunit epsilon